MEKRREISEVLLDIRNEIPGFKKEDLLEYLKWAIPKLYNLLVNKKEIEVKCKEELINKLNKQRLKYRITENIDHMNVQYAELFDNVKSDNETHVQIYLSIYFYDKVSNNIGNKSVKDIYWNDIWIVTCRENTKTTRNTSNCVNCGAVMDYIQTRDAFECKYCGNIINNKTNSNWEIVDIELGN